MMTVFPNRQSVLVVGRDFPIANSNGSATHMRSLLDYLYLNGVDVYFLHLGSNSLKSYDLPSCKQVIVADCVEKCLNFDDLPTKMEIDCFVKTVSAIQPQNIIVDYSWLSILYDYIPKNLGQKRIVFCHDLRTHIIPSFEQMGFIHHGNIWSEQNEGALLRKAHAVLVLHDGDEETIKLMAPDVKIIRIGIAAQPKLCLLTSETPGRCLYLGSNVPENLFAIAWLINNVWPIVRSNIAHASLSICGGVCDGFPSIFSPTIDVRSFMEEYGIRLEGRVNDLKQSYAQSCLSLIPHWMNGGIKLKLVESLAHGRAIVGTSRGLDGIKSVVGRCGLEADDPTAFAQNIITLLQNDELRHKMHTNALYLAIEELNSDKAYSSLLNFIKY